MDEMVTERNTIQSEFCDDLSIEETFLANRKKIAIISAERDVLKTSHDDIVEENDRLKRQSLEMNKTVESLLSEIEDLKEEFERSSAREVDANTLRIECYSIRGEVDEMVTERNKIQSEFCDDLSIDETFLANRKKVAIISAEKDVLKTSHDDIVEENDRLKRHSLEMNKTVESLLSEIEVLMQEYVSASAREFDADTLRNECNSIRVNLDLMLNERNKIQAEFCDDLSVEESLLAMRKEVVILSAERDVLKLSHDDFVEENGRLMRQSLEMNKTIESLLSEIEDLKEEVERISARDVEADVLSIECNSMKVKMDEMISERNRIQAEFCEDLSIEEALLALRTQVAILSAERDVIKAQREQVTYVDVSIASQPTHDLRGAAEETEMLVERLKNPFISPSSKSEDTQIQLQTRVVDCSQAFVKKESILRLHKLQLFEYKQKQLDQNDIIKQIKCENEAMQEYITKLQEEITQYQQRERDQDEIIKDADSQHKRQLRRIRSLERVIRDNKMAEKEQIEVITRLEGKIKNLSEYIRRLENEAIEAKEKFLEQDKAMEDMQSRNKELTDCIKTLKYDDNSYKAKQQMAEEVEMFTEMESEYGKLMDCVRKLKNDIHHSNVRELEKDVLLRDMENQIKYLCIAAIEGERTDMDSESSPDQNVTPENTKIQIHFNPGSTNIGDLSTNYGKEGPQQ
ncbi:hypothetical protein L798_15699 [Zootermopsis nevadensis]|uniref:Uncharacterized protein n=2 Tax=Zootermopsis nevadensis TaxID=136037 RepID=A0A067QL89_ZOONE|nr:hypothetical protein L798_15699 [Zootermopsis nevadensis]